MALESVSSATDETQKADPASNLKGSFRQRIRKAGVVGFLTNILAFLGLLISATGNLAWLTYLVAALVVVVILTSNSAKAPLRKNKVRPAGEHLVARTLTLIAVAIAALGVEPEPGWGVVALYGLLLLGEPVCAQAARGAVPTAWNVPGVSVKNVAPYPAALVFYTNIATFILMSALLATGLEAYGLIPLAIAIAFMAWTMFESVMRLRQRRHAEARLRSVLIDFAPEFMVYWDAPKDSAYQLTMWLPYLDRLGMRYTIVTRNAQNFFELEHVTDAPVLQRYRHTDIDEVLVPSITTVFYVNNASRNMHMVRYPGVKHVELNHGESDKTPSFSPVMRMYDKVFAAGQAMIDRFSKNGVTVYSPSDLFEIVGRPQVESVEVQLEPARGGARRVLYAPTWAGFHADSSYCSLVIGERVVSALIARGCEVIYRPHPHTHKSKELTAISDAIKLRLEQDAAASGRKHIWGSEAEKNMSVFDCFNSVGAMIADVSSVVPDFLYSNKPFAICAMQGTFEEFEAENPIAAGGYLVDSAGDNLEKVLDDLLEGDPKWSARNALKKYYLGDLPHDGYSEVFVSAATSLIRRA